MRPALSVLCLCLLALSSCHEPGHESPIGAALGQAGISLAATLAANGYIGADAERADEVAALAGMINLVLRDERAPSPEELSARLRDGANAGGYLADFIQELAAIYAEQAPAGPAAPDAATAARRRVLAAIARGLERASAEVERSGTE